MRKIEDFILIPIDGEKSNWLARVNAEIAKGYELHGSPFYDGATETTYQAMVLYEK